MVAVVFAIVYAASMGAAILLIAQILRTPRLNPARGSLATYLAATVVWTALALDFVVRTPGNPAVTQAWMMPTVALMVAAATTTSHSLANPAWRPSGQYMGALAIHPLVMLMVAMVPPWHSLLVTADADGNAHYAILFWIHAAVSYSLLGLAGLRLVRHREQVRAVAGRSVLVFLLVWMVPIAANLTTVWHEGAGGPDLTPIAFVLTALVIGRAVVLDGFADVVPIARVHVFENFTDAVVVLDPWGRVMDVNTTALRLLGEDRFAADLKGRPLHEVSPGLTWISGQDGEHDIDLDGNSLVLDVKHTELRDNSGREIGALVHLRDVTVAVTQRRDLIQTRDALTEEVRINEALRAALAEQVVRDSGTGLLNRRYVFEVLPEISRRCVDEDIPLSVVLVDIDHFKGINDTYGHAVGDRALRAVADALQAVSGEGIVARFGGEEFIVLLPGLATAEAVAVAERMRRACASVHVHAREGEIAVTLSAGVATSGAHELDAARLIDAADRALYEAKNSGRNTTSVAPDASFERGEA